MKIGEIANIQAGYQFRSKVESESDGNYSVIQIKDIENRRRLTPESMESITSEKSLESYIVSKGDILFLSRGHNRFAVAIEDDLQNTIASGYFYILRLQTDLIQSTYTAWYINQKSFQDQLMLFARGTHMPFISKKDFVELEIPVPPLEVQNKIVSIADLAHQEQVLIEDIASKRATLIQTLTLTAAEDASSYSC